MEDHPACTVIEVVVAMLAFTEVFFLASIALVVVLAAGITVQCVFLSYLNKAARRWAVDRLIEEGGAWAPPPFSL